MNWRMLLVVILVCAVVAFLSAVAVGNWFAAGANWTLIAVVIGDLFREATDRRQR